MLVENKADSIVLILLIAGSVYLYMQYSPSLYLAQDPSIYLLKALNLVNYGYCYKPMHIYSGFIAENIIEPMAEYTNGIYYEMPNVYADFFSGKQFFLFSFWHGFQKYDLLCTDCHDDSECVAAVFCN